MSRKISQNWLIFLYGLCYNKQRYRKRFGMSKVLKETIFSYTVFLKCTSLIDPVKSSLLASIEPISAVFFAFFLMN